MKFFPYKIIWEGKKKLKESKKYWIVRGEERCLFSKAVQGKILLAWIYLQYVKTSMVESYRLFLVNL